jgi:hypothetical protein
MAVLGHSNATGEDSDPAADKNEYISEDLNHFSIKGAAAAATVAWEAMKQRGVIPR